ncbi:peptide deformylase [Arthrobacter halodurans]|uniref:Peptide deformylase n=1 Tax=Arthrobacter halodurans TaxID=516699 RepID=A0ABV4ULS4_9MICC
MTVRPIVIYGEESLHRRAAEVTSFDDELRGLVDDMFETMDEANGVGLAAPQIGVSLRIFTYNFVNDDGAPSRGVVVNPRLTLSKVSGAQPDPEDEVEGCLSAPGLSFPLKRAEYARVQGFDADGNAVDFEATDWFARVMQHEYDHLDGQLYVDRLNDKWSRRWKKAKRQLEWGGPGLSWMPGVDPDPFGH